MKGPSAEVEPYEPAHGSTRVTSAIPARAGSPLKGEHAARILSERPELGFFEIHAENYMVAGGPRLAVLERIRAAYPLSVHGVGLSLGSPGRPDPDHLASLRGVVRRFEPGLVSEHVAWSGHDGRYLADLLPFPFTEESLGTLCVQVDEIQEVLGRRLLIENPSNYLLLPNSTIPEPEFIAEVARRTGCGLLIDVNNVQVSAFNVGIDPLAYVDGLSADAVGQLHIAGASLDAASGRPLLIDDHGASVSDEVWRLYDRLIGRIGPRPTTLEWDNDVPSWPDLYREAQLAERRLIRFCRTKAA